MVYLDNSATTKQYDEVTEEMLKYMREDFGNPSALYGPGVTAEKAVKNARNRVAAALLCDPAEISFTSGGTESDNMAVYGAAKARQRIGQKIILSDVEHPAMDKPCKRLQEEGFNVVFLGVDDKCRIDIDQLKEEIDQDTIFISIMHVNNEVGTIQPLKEIAELKNSYNKTNRNKNTGILLHTDAVQSFGKLEETKELKKWGVDMMSLSGHKFHGPKGIGALYLREGITIPPFIVGGGQEKGARSGTENVPAIAGMGLAAEIAAKECQGRREKISQVRKYLLEGIKAEIGDIRINSLEREGCCPSVLNISFLGTRGEVILHSLEEKEIYVSTGSACSSNKNGKSHVLKAMGLKEKEIEGAIRFSFSEFNTIEQMDYVLEHLKIAVNRFRKLGSFR